METILLRPGLEMVLLYLLRVFYLERKPTNIHILFP